MNALKNPLAEEIAIKISEFLPDKKLASFVYNEFLNVCPNLKKWEALAIADRAMFLHRQKVEVKI